MIWIKYIGFWFLFACSVLWYVSTKISSIRNSLPRSIGIKWLIKMALIFRISYASLLTILQYYLWSNDPFAKLLLNVGIDISLPLPLVKDLPWLFDNKLGYFIFYSWGRFWLDVVISLVVAYVFYFFLKILKRHQERFFEEGEVGLGLALSLIVGWPGFIIFVPLIFISVVIVSMARQILLGERYTTLGVPFIAAALLTLATGDWLVRVFNLGLFKI
ncbi:hypothetical protein HY967_00400 [Candidatus Jorgensenbacteria bacterium]|nr:hypothetical protein [Candidatus Jorgensenbacteria bacterium]